MKISIVICDNYVLPILKMLIIFVKLFPTIAQITNNMGSTIENKNVFRAELHVHTPSSDCYKGPNTDEEYLRILEAACENKISILAITDHNSIKGYSKMRALRQRVVTEYNTLVNINDSKEAKAKVKQLKKTIEAFESVFLIPGVEFEVNNGIHLLVLFNPTTPESTIEKFLVEGGYEDKTFGRENDVFSNWSIFELYKESRKYDCVVIDAHSDSDKGIFNTLTGQARVHAFTDPSLIGICYKNEKQKRTIESIITQHSRKTPIAFLKSSDSHQTSEVGRDISFFRIDEINWESFKEAFKNPTECIFTTYPETNSIIKNVASSGSCLFIGQLDNSTRTTLAQYICGLANSNGGYIIIGADSIQSINGEPEKRLEELITLLREVIDSIPALTNLNINEYPINDKSIVIVVRVAQSEELLGIEKDGCVYCYQNKRIETLNASEIQSLITLRLTSRFSERVNTELESIRKKTTVIDAYFKSLPILNSFYNNSVFLSSVVDNVRVVEPIHLTPQKFASLNDSIEKHANGVSRGNIYFFENEQKPRLNDAYLRITIPCYNVKDLGTVKKEESLFFIPGGAVFYSTKSLNCYYNSSEPVIKLLIRKNYSIKFLCAYLKSSFYLWYLLNKFNTLDVIPPSSYNCIRIPLVFPNNPDHSSLVQKIEKLFDEIVAEEKDFLAGETKLKNTEEHLKYIKVHNESVKKLFMQIDELIFALLGISDGEKRTIIESLKVNGIYVPDLKY